MKDKLQPAVDALVSRFGAQIIEQGTEFSLEIDAHQIIAACQTLQAEFGFDVLADETAVDYWPQQTPRFNVVYQLYSLMHKKHLCLRVPVSGETSVVPSIEKVFPNANWHEREIWDMFGVRFEGHSDLRRILLPADWEGHPLRKDYPLGFEEVQFSFNFDEINLRKHYSKE